MRRGKAGLRPIGLEEAQEFLGFEFEVESLSAMAFVIGDRVVGMCGIVFLPERAIAFSDLTSEIREHPFTLARGAVWVKRQVSRCPGPVISIEDKNEPTAERLNDWLGTEVLR